MSQTIYQRLLVRVTHSRSTDLDLEIPIFPINHLRRAPINVNYMRQKQLCCSPSVGADDLCFFDGFFTFCLRRGSCIRVAEKINVRRSNDAGLSLDNYDSIGKIKGHIPQNKISDVPSLI